MVVARGGRLSCGCRPAEPPPLTETGENTTARPRTASPAATATWLTFLFSETRFVIHVGLVRVNSVRRSAATAPLDGARCRSLGSRADDAAADVLVGVPARDRRRPGTARAQAVGEPGRAG